MPEINIARNKKASFEYEFLDKYTAGIQLTGTEVKSLRLGKLNFGDAFCLIDGNEVYVKSLHINEYAQGNIYNHNPLRMRKLLLRKREILRLDKKLKEKGLTLIPIRLFFSDRGFAKMDIALAKGKKLYDKRESLKENDHKKQMKTEY